MFKLKDTINDINKLRKNVDMQKYNDLDSTTKEFGNLLYEDFGKIWQNEILAKELIKYKKDLEKNTKIT